MLENYRVYKVDGKVIGDYITLDEARHVANRHKGSRIATKKNTSHTEEWNYSAIQGRLF